MKNRRNGCCVVRGSRGQGVKLPRLFPVSTTGVVVLGVHHKRQPLHDKIKPKDSQAASPLVIQGFSNFLGLFQVIMANPWNPKQPFIDRCLVKQPICKDWEFSN